ncbi:MAG: SHOCT domain-containing protein [Clostridia bacterium]|nr:SHOCT domain-containing protein [Clostridia bacterium]
MKNKKLFTLLAALGTMLFAFLALCFNIVTVSSDFADVSIAENGFDLLGGTEYDDFVDCAGWLQTFSILLLIAVIAEALIYAYLAYTKNEKAEKTLKIFVIVNVVLTLIYMINGFIAVGDVESAVSDLSDILDEDIDISKYVDIKTEAFLPLIFTVLCAVAYFVLDRMPETVGVQPTAVKESVAAASASETKGYIDDEHTADMLIKYKGLLDQGVITQEEYDQKKTELLKK